ncbi:MAG: ABC transporter permease [Planctomycetota bacterium]
MKISVPRHWFSTLAPFLAVVVVVLLFQVYAPDQPMTLRTWQYVAAQTVVVGLAAVGMTWVIISAGIDLSVGSVIALSGVSAALAVESGAGALGGVLAALVTGAICGAYNGVLIVGLRLPPFIATLGTMGFYRGVAKWVAANESVRPEDSAGVSFTAGIADWVKPVSAGQFLAPSVWLLLGVTILGAWALRWTVLGRHTVAIGSNELTARLCGIQIQQTKIAIYAFAGLLAGLAGVMLFGRLTVGDPTSAVGIELDVIAAVVIGGASLAGGQGSVTGALAGALLMAVLRNRCTAVGWPNFVQEMIVGHIIVLAVAIDQWRIRRMNR